MQGEPDQALVMDGFEFVYELRKTGFGQSVTVVVLTAMEMDGEARDNLMENVASIVRKAGTSAEQILEITRQALNDWLLTIIVRNFKIREYCFGKDTAG